MLLATRALYEAMYRFDGVLAERLGVHRSDVRGLNALETGPLTPGELGHRLGLTSGAVTALVDRLLGAGLVDRTPDPNDRRRWQIALRPAAFRKLDTLFSTLGRTIEETMATGRRPSTDVLAAALSGLSDAFDEAAVVLLSVD